jgi:outer membrane protein OmpA-like peptidoglycan-associated protein
MYKIIYVAFLFLSLELFSQSDIEGVTNSCKQEITGFIKNYKNGEIIQKSLVQLFTNGQLVTTIETGSDGSYRFLLDCGNRYNINARFENFTINSKIIYTSLKSENKNLDLFLYPTREFVEKNTNKYIDIDGIDFDTDADLVSDASQKQLYKVVNIMRKYPEIRISVDVHTDSKGEPAYALEITKQRADVIVNHLIEMGIEGGRLEFNGYGDTQLVNHCAKDIKCTEAEHKANKRIEFMVID